MEGIRLEMMLEDASVKVSSVASTMTTGDPGGDDRRGGIRNDEAPTAAVAGDGLMSGCGGVPGSRRGWR